MTSSRRQIVTYLFLVLLFSSVFYFFMIRAHALAAGGGYYAVGIMWCPALAAFATLKMNGRSFSKLGWKWPAGRYAFASWFVPLAYTAVAYLIVWGMGLGGFPNREFMQSLTTKMGLGLSPAGSTVLYVLLVGSFGMVRSLSTGLGEEIGWRGFLVPELSKNVSFTTTAVISGSVVGVALPDSDFCRLQRRNRDMVRADLLYGDDRLGIVPVRLATIEVGKPVDGSVAARQPQLVCAGDLFSADE